MFKSTRIGYTRCLEDFFHLTSHKNCPLKGYFQQFHDRGGTVGCWLSLLSFVIRRFHFYDRGNKLDTFNRKVIVASFRFHIRCYTTKTF